METKMIKRKINRIENFLKSLTYETDGNEDKFTFHRGWTIGYYEGKLSVLYDILDNQNKGE